MYSFTACMIDFNIINIYYFGLFRSLKELLSSLLKNNCKLNMFKEYIYLYENNFFRIDETII